MLHVQIVCLSLYSHCVMSTTYPLFAYSEVPVFIILVNCLLSQIRQEDVDFHQYYRNRKLKELKKRMERKQYPPRCSTKVNATNKHFFTKSQRSISFQITCNAKCVYRGKILIPCSNGMYICMSIANQFYIMYIYM